MPIDPSQVTWDQPIDPKQVLWKPIAPTYDPTADMSTTQRVLAGIGDGMVGVGRAVGLGNWLESQGFPGTKEYADNLDARLKSTTSGKVGNVLGQAAIAAPAALIPGANTYLGASLIGAGTGALFTEGDAADRAKAAAFGAAGGAAGKGLGDLLGWGIPKVVQSLGAGRVAAQAANAQRDAAATAAQQAGYVIPPADVNSNWLNETLGGLSGKVKTAQVASQRNQDVTNGLARNALGISSDTPLNVDTLRAIRTSAGQAYDAVRGAGTVTADQQYADALNGIKSTYQGAAKDFPGLANDQVSSLVDTLNQPTFDAGSAVDAIKVLRGTADKAFKTGDTGFGNAAKSAAGEMESMLDRHLQASGAPADLVQNFQQARQTIAKTYSVEKALNGETGDVSAQALAAQSRRGAPLSGELDTIGSAGMAFPKATQTLKETPKAFSPLDFMLSGGLGLVTHNPMAMATLAARPAARSLLLSKPYQGLLGSPQSYGPGMLEQTLPLLGSDPMRRSLSLGGGLLGSDLSQ